VKRVIYLLCFLAFCYGCKSQQPISVANDKLCKIEYSKYGGMLGFKETLTLTQDSILYTSLIGRTHKREEGFEKTPAAIWEKLDSSADILQLDSLKSGESRLPHDGKDTKYIISLCSGKKYLLINVEDSNAFKKMNSFFTTIIEIKNNIKKTEK